MTSMKDVAKLAGVSVSTVSRVINSIEGVDKKTRKRVEDAIKKVNYKPNLLASGLRSKSGNLIGLVVPEIAHPSFSEFIKYNEQFVREMGYGLIIGSTSNNPEKEQLFIDQLIRRNVDGIIFIRVSNSDQAISQLTKTQIPFIVLDRGSENEDYPSVLMDNEGAGRLAAKHLMDLGHKQIACLTGPQNLSLCRDRLTGFITEIESRGLSLPQSRIFEGDFKFANGVQFIKDLLANDSAVSAVWAQNDMMALGVMAGARDLGLELPRDLSVVGVDDVNCSHMVRPRLTTIRQPFKEMSRMAVELVITKEVPQKEDNSPQIVPVELLVRESTAQLEK